MNSNPSFKGPLPALSRLHLADRPSTNRYSGDTFRRGLPVPSMNIRREKPNPGASPLCVIVLIPITTMRRAVRTRHFFIFAPRWTPEQERHWDSHSGPLLEFQLADNAGFSA